MAKTQGNFLDHQTLHIDGKSYVQRFVQCRRSNCWCMTMEGHPKTGAPAHGPYWYRVIKLKGNKTVNRYIGKELVRDGEAKASK